MSEIIGKWVQIEGQPFEGLWFQFNDDGTFEAQYDAMGIESSGTYEIEADKITMQQTAHTFGLLGEFKGLFEIVDDQLKMALAGGPEQGRPEDLSTARIYQKSNE